MLDDAQRARVAIGVTIDPSNPEARDVVNECQALADLGEWYGHKLRSASALAVYERTGAGDYLDAARAETDAAGQAWMSLASDASYILQFDENLRMRPLGVSPFHWSRPEVLLRLGEDRSSIDAVEAHITANPPDFTGDLPPASVWLDTPRGPGPGLMSLDITPQDPCAPEWTVSTAFRDDLPAGSAVNILWKPFSATTDWRSVPATQVGSGYQATIAGGGQGAMFAVEILSGSGEGWRYPDIVQETPYRTLSPVAAQTTASRKSIARLDGSK